MVLDTGPCQRTDDNVGTRCHAIAPMLDGFSRLLLEAKVTMLYSYLSVKICFNVGLFCRWLLVSSDEGNNGTFVSIGAAFLVSMLNGFG
jgi:hypothetical protein